MSSLSEGHRINAAACLRIARTTPRDTDKKWLEDIAAQWLRIAEETDNQQALFTNGKEPSAAA